MKINENVINHRVLVCITPSRATLAPIGIQAGVGHVFDGVWHPLWSYNTPHVVINITSVAIYHNTCGQLAQPLWSHGAARTTMVDLAAWVDHLTQ
jgi:hypothetical protein